MRKWFWWVNTLKAERAPAISTFVLRPVVAHVLNIDGKEFNALAMHAFVCAAHVKSVLEFSPQLIYMIRNKFRSKFRCDSVTSNCFNWIEHSESDPTINHRKIYKKKSALLFVAIGKQVDASYRPISNIRYRARVVPVARAMGQNCSIGRPTWQTGPAVRVRCGRDWKGLFCSVNQRRISFFISFFISTPSVE